MMLNVSYMGTKRRLAPVVSEVISFAQAGAMLDVFSGMCAVASAVAPTRSVWCNDVQLFAKEVAAAFFTSTEGPSSSGAMIEQAYRRFCRNFNALANRFGSELAAETEALDSGECGRIATTDASAPNIATSDLLTIERARMSSFPQTFPYRLFTITFSGAYFGLKQCIEIDSIRYAADQLLSRKTIRQDQHRWMLLALCKAACKVANSTGHFAQYLKVKHSNVARFVRQRRRSVWSEWQDAIRTLEPIGSCSWRETNLAIQCDALTLLSKLVESKRKPAVIYADPPYTADHYSRFYHLYETLLQYDYPRSLGVGRYRPQRFTSQFSLKAKVAYQMELLIERCSAIGAELVLSYPEDGLFKNSKDKIISMLRRHYAKYETHEVKHFHSSLGGSKGVEKYPVTEVIYRAHRSRRNTRGQCRN